jgi:hypothetical protein
MSGWDFLEMSGFEIHNWLRVSQGSQIRLKSFVGKTFANFHRIR